MTTCPLCQQAIRKAAPRRCVSCGRPILLHHRWQFLGCVVAHLDCDRPEGKPEDGPAQEPLTTEEA